MTPEPFILDWSPLRTWRRRLDLTQRELGRLVGRSGALIGLIEAGERQPSVHTAFAFARGLGVPLFDLVTVVDDAMAEDDQ